MTTLSQRIKNVANMGNLSPSPTLREELIKIADEVAKIEPKPKAPAKKK